MPERPLEILVPSVMRKELSRRIVLSGLVASGAAAALAACAPSTGGGGSTGGGAINLYTWGEYDDPKVLKAFAKTKSGATIKLGSYDSNEELIAKLSAAKGTSGYDIVVPTLGFVPQMVSLKLLQELDHSKLPNLKNVDPNYLNTDSDKGNKYSVPKAFGASGYVYDTTVIKRDLTSWADFFDAVQKEAKGKTSLLADPNEILWAYFFSIGQDINTNDTATLDKARDFLVKHIAPNVQAFESYVSNTIAQNGRVLAHSWNGDARQGILSNSDKTRYKWVACWVCCATTVSARSRGTPAWVIVASCRVAIASCLRPTLPPPKEISFWRPVPAPFSCTLTGVRPMPVSFVKPTEGAGQFLDNWAIPVGAKNVDEAHTFINYVLDPDVSLKELVYIGYNTAISGISTKATAAGVEMTDLIFYTPDETKKLVFDIVPKSQEHRVAIFNEIQAAAGH